MILNVSHNIFPVLTGFMLFTKLRGLVHCGFAQVLIKRWMNRSKDRNNQSVLGAFHMCNALCPPGEGHRLMNGPISQINRGRENGSWIVSKNVLLA